MDMDIRTPIRRTIRMGMDILITAHITGPATSTGTGRITGTTGAGFTAAGNSADLQAERVVLNALLI